MDLTSLSPANLMSLAPADLKSKLEELLASAPTGTATEAGTSPTTAATSLPGLDRPLEGGSVGPAFGEVLNGFLKQVDAVQHRSDAMVESLALGEPVDVHQVMLALSEASNALHLTLQVRNKVLDAYQEFMRLPM